MSTINLGTLTNSPQVGSEHILSIAESTDVFQFSLASTRNINLALTDISTGDDADLRLYRDSNNNGVLDSSDELVKSSSLGGNHDDSINVAAQAAGTYFAEVSRYDLGSSGDVSYNLQLSSTPSSPTTSPSNLLPTEFEVGSLNNLPDQSYSNSEAVGNNDTADVYHFTLDNNGFGYGYDFDLKLTGLSSDADVRLIRDLNRNGIVDTGEEISRSQLGGTTSESLGREIGYGDYFVQVYQYSGDTSYQLNMQVSPIIG
jgi:hypothetical protein